ncbi:MAG: ATP-binding protein [Proteobacteria bacterium]|nr:ATP-binding protein [Pseudomonadota bacterium]
MSDDGLGLRLSIASEADVVIARTRGKELAKGIGFGLVDQTRIATGISELTRNILQYAQQGHITLRLVDASTPSPFNTFRRKGLEIVAEDHGPGIRDLNQILEGRSLSGRGLGLGIPGTRRLMDEFEIVSESGSGTRVRCIKWLA